jgi:hypothetical protein
VRRGANLGMPPAPARVPRISAFYGIVITMYYDDHEPPHFHARHGGYEAAILVAGGRRLAGVFPARALRMVQEWAVLHRDELKLNWHRARRGLPLVPIDPIA